MVPAALITAVYDSYDTLKPYVPQVGLVEAVCVTDDPNLRCEGWRMVCDPQPGMHPNRAAKRPKMLPHEYTDAPASVWVDASFDITSPTFVYDVLELADPIAQFLHPNRGCLFAESLVSAPLPKYVGEPMEGQHDAYVAAGMPERWGLWSTGVIARHHTDGLAKWGQLWLDEIVRWSFQDQVSHPYVCWRTGIRPTELPGSHMHNAWVTYRGSRRH